MALLLPLRAVAESGSILPDAPSMGQGNARPVLLSEQSIDLSLSDVVYLGLRNNRRIRSSYLQRIAQKFDLRVAADAFNPKLLLRSDYRASRSNQDRMRNGILEPTATLLGEYGTRFSLVWAMQWSDTDESGLFRSDGFDLSVVQPLLRGAAGMLPPRHYIRHAWRRRPIDCNSRPVCRRLSLK